MDLWPWLKVERKEAKWLGEKIGRGATNISWYLSRKRSPSYLAAVKILTLAKGKVGLKDVLSDSEVIQYEEFLEKEGLSELKLEVET